MLPKLPKLPSLPNLLNFGNSMFSRSGNEPPPQQQQQYLQQQHQPNTIRSTIKVIQPQQPQQQPQLLQGGPPRKRKRPRLLHRPPLSAGQYNNYDVTSQLERKQIDYVTIPLNQGQQRHEEEDELRTLHQLAIPTRYHSYIT